MLDDKPCGQVYRSDGGTSMSGTIAQDKAHDRKATVVRRRGVRHEQEHSSPSRITVGQTSEIAADFRMHAGWTFIKTA
jgi:hypothetical protein